MRDQKAYSEMTIEQLEGIIWDSMLKDTYASIESLRSAQVELCRRDMENSQLDETPE